MILKDVLVANNAFHIIEDYETFIQDNPELVDDIVKNGALMDVTDEDLINFKLPESVVVINSAACLKLLSGNITVQALNSLFPLAIEDFDHESLIFHEQRGDSTDDLINLLEVEPVLGLSYLMSLIDEDLIGEPEIITTTADVLIVSGIYVDVPNFNLFQHLQPDLTQYVVKDGLLIDIDLNNPVIPAIVVAITETCLTKLLKSGQTHLVSEVMHLPSVEVVEFDDDVKRSIEQALSVERLTHLTSINPDKKEKDILVEPHTTRRR